MADVNNLKILRCHFIQHKLFSQCTKFYQIFGPKASKRWQVWMILNS